MGASNTPRRRMEVTVKNHQKKIPPRSLPNPKIVRAILKYLRVKNATLSIVFITRQKIQSLNKKYLHRSYATDVLAFDFTQGKKKDGLVGDIFISTDAVLANAKVFKNDVKSELVLYVIHGILHLLGYDDHSAKDVTRMKKKEQEILEYVGRKLIFKG